MDDLPDYDERVIKDADRAMMARSKLVLQCENPAQHGFGSVWVEMDGDRVFAADVHTKAEAFRILRGFRATGGGPQVEFLHSIRHAAWLLGPMPSALLTAPGTYHPAGKPTVVPMDAQRVATLRAGDPDFDRRQIHLLRELSPGLL